MGGGAICRTHYGGKADARSTASCDQLASARLSTRVVIEFWLGLIHRTQEGCSFVTGSADFERMASRYRRKSNVRKQAFSREVFMAHKQTVINPEEMKERIRLHQPGQGLLKTTLEIEWKPYPGYAPSVRSAVVAGQPSEKGLYTIRVKVPHGMKLMPHKHPEDRVYTVISGVFYIGLGGEFDAEKLEAYPPGAGIVLPGNTPHFHGAKSGEYISQITAIGSAGLEFVNPKDDLRKVSSAIAAQPRFSRTVSRRCISIPEPRRRPIA